MKRVFFCVLLFAVSFVYGNASEEVFGDNLLLLYPAEDREMVGEASSTFNIPLEVLVRQDFLESTFDSSVCYLQDDGYYSIGYRQINTRFLDGMVERFHYFDEEFDINNEKHLYFLGCNYMAYLIEHFDSAMIGALSYNAGPTKVRNRIEEVPQRSWDYAYFVLTGEGRGVYYNRMLEYNRLVRKTCR